MSHDIEYSDKYSDEVYEYRHVILPKELSKQLDPNRLMSETEWRGIGVQQSHGWVHYMIHRPEPHVLLFRRPIGTDAKTGRPTTQWLINYGVEEKYISEDERQRLIRLQRESA